MLHPEFLVDGRLAAAQHDVDQPVDRVIVRVQPLRHLAIGQEFPFRLEAQDVVHRLRPEDAAARDVPVPQSAVAAVERLVHPLGGNGQRLVSLGSASRLPVEGGAQQHQHAQRHQEQGNDLLDRRLPVRQHARLRMYHRDLAWVGAKGAQRDVDLFARRRDRQQRRAQRARGAQHRVLAEQRRQVEPLHHRVFRIARLDEARLVGDHEHPAPVAGVRRQHFLQVRCHRRAHIACPGGADAQRGAEVARSGAQHQCGLVVGKLDRPVAARRQLQEHGGRQRYQEQQDQAGDQVAQDAFGNGDGRDAPGADTDLECPLLEKQFAKFGLGHAKSLSRPLLVA